MPKLSYFLICIKIVLISLLNSATHNNSDATFVAISAIFILHKILIFKLMRELSTMSLSCLLLKSGLVSRAEKFVRCGLTEAIRVSFSHPW